MKDDPISNDSSLPEGTSIIKETYSEGELDSLEIERERERKRRRTEADRRKRGRSTSFLVQDTDTMERKRRLIEQRGHRKFGSVKAREHNEEQNQNAAPEGELQNSINQHDLLNNQRYDGVSPELNPDPPLNSLAKMEMDNAQREQDKEKQLRLGNMPAFDSAPKPRGPNP